ncbi:MAG TPA: hypothetical protein VJS92_14800, partial [Candidatus Polarisedimenticolaceae bacterium]|nr:hypothetical protein [Candidatus Polarisedimenticolaceae bacterium]
LQRVGAQGFVLEWDERSALHAVCEGEGLRVEGDAEVEGWQLRTVGSAQGYVLCRGETELGRTSALPGVGASSRLRHLLLDDGRLFRIVGRGARSCRFEVLGWEVSGAYVVARAEVSGWTLQPMPAASGLVDLRVIALLLAAEIREAELAGGGVE